MLPCKAETYYLIFNAFFVFISLHSSLHVSSTGGNDILKF